MKTQVRLYDAFRRGLITLEEYQKRLKNGMSPNDRIEVETF